MIISIQFSFTPRQNNRPRLTTAQAASSCGPIGESIIIHWTRHATSFTGANSIFATGLLFGGRFSFSKDEQTDYADFVNVTIHMLRPSKTLVP